MKINIAIRQNVELLGKDVKAGITKYILDFQTSMSMQGLSGTRTKKYWQQKETSLAPRLQCNSMGEDRVRQTSGRLAATDYCTILRTEEKNYHQKALKFN